MGPQVVGKTVPSWRGLRSAHAAFLSHVRQSCFFVIKQNFFLDNKVPGGLDTGEASRFVTSFFEVAGYNCGQMRAPKMVPFDGPNFGAVFISWNRNWFRRADPESPPSKSAFYLSSAAGIRLACVDGPVNSIHEGDACIVAVSLWRDNCNYNSAHAAFLSHVRQSCFFVIKQNFFWTTKFLEGLTEEIWTFGALCLYWCDVELHI